MTKKRKHHRINIQELSAVDRPAQKGAVMNIMKRDNSLSSAIKKALDESAGSGEKAVIENIQSLLNKAAVGGGKSEGDSMDPKDKKDADEKAKKDQEAKKSLDEANAKLKKSEEDLEESKKELKKAKALAELNDSEKAFYNSLEGDSKDDFLSKSATDRASQIEMQKSDNPVVYTSANGDEFRKSDDPRLVDMARRADASEKAMQKALEDQANTVFAKRASEEMGNISGSDDEKTAFYKYMDGAPEEVKGFVSKMTKALNDQNGEHSKEHGEKYTKSEKGVEDAQQEMEKKATEYAKANDVPYEDAFSVVCSQNPQLYTKAYS
jgi:hypothetical protein